MLIASSTKSYHPKLWSAIFRKPTSIQSPFLVAQKNAASAYNIIDGRWGSHQRQKTHLASLRLFDDVHHRLKDDCIILITVVEWESTFFQRTFRHPVSTSKMPGLLLEHDRERLAGRCNIYIMLGVGTKYSGR